MGDLIDQSYAQKKDTREKQHIGGFWFEVYNGIYSLCCFIAIVVMRASPVRMDVSRASFGEMTTMRVTVVMVVVRVVASMP